jgi:hypothetical protein
MRSLLISFVAFLVLGEVQAQEVSQSDPVTPTVVVSELVQNNIDFFYTMADRAELEAPFCMMGKVDPKKNTATISELRLTRVDSASNGNIFFDADSCSKSGSIGLLHFHTGVGFCKLSADDIVFAHESDRPAIAFVCREKADEDPKLIVVLREVFDAEWEKLRAGKVISRDASRPPVTYRSSGRKPGK